MRQSSEVGAAIPAAWWRQEMRRTFSVLQKIDIEGKII